MRRCALLLMLLAGCADKKEDAAPPDEGAPPLTVTGIRWEDRKPDGTGTLYVHTSDGGERLVDRGAIDHWFSSDRSAVYFSYRHGKSGYEREGMGIKRYLVEPGESEVVFEHDLMVMFVREAASKTRRSALLVEMIDGGRGAPELVVADPGRGRVFVAELAKAVGVEDGSVTVGYYTDEQIDSAEFGQFPAPSRTEALDLDELLDRDASRETPNPMPD